MTSIVAPSLAYTALSGVALLKEQGAPMLDIADEDDNTFKTLSPYYPHGSIECPGWATAATIEGIWQACKSIGTRAPGFTNDAFLNMVPPKFREPRDGERLFGWRHNGGLVQKDRANRALFIAPYLNTVKERCETEIKALHELISATSDRIYVYDSSFVERNDGHDDPALVFTTWFNTNPVRVSN